MTVRTALFCTMMAFSAAALSDAASAQGTQQQRNACMGDAFRFCFSQIPNHKQIEACLRANRRKLSNGCFHEIYDDGPATTGSTKKVTESSNHAPE